MTVARPKLFDAHTHVQFQAFAEDREQVLQRALGVGIWVINVGTQKNTSDKAVKIARCYDDGVYATVGLHPIHTEKSYHDPQELGGGEGFTSKGEEFDYAYYKKLAQDIKVVAVGECGLDYYRLENESKEKQKTAFIQQIELSCEIKKPLMIHCRSAFTDLISILESSKSLLQQPAGVVHFFSGNKEEAGKLMDLGFSFTFGGVLTFSRDYDEVVKYIPLANILLETDAPYISPVPYRGKRNESVYVLEVAKKLAGILNVSFDEVCATTVENTFRLFKL